MNYKTSVLLHSVCSIWFSFNFIRFYTVLFNTIQYNTITYIDISNPSDCFVSRVKNIVRDHFWTITQYNIISIQTKSLKPFRYFFSNEKNVNINKHLISSYRMKFRILQCVSVFFFLLFSSFSSSFSYVLFLLYYEIRKKGK